MDLFVQFLGGVGETLGKFALSTTSKLVEKLIEAEVKLAAEKTKGGNAGNQTLPMVLLGVSVTMSAANAVWTFVLSRQRPGDAPLPPAPPVPIEAPETRNVNVQITLTRPPPSPSMMKKLKLRGKGGPSADDETYQTIAITNPEVLRAFMTKVMEVVENSKNATSGEITIDDEVIDSNMIQILNDLLMSVQIGGDASA